MSSNQGQDLEKHLQATKVFFHAGSFKINFDPLAKNSDDSMIIRVFQNGSKFFWHEITDSEMTQWYLSNGSFFPMHVDHVLKSSCWSWVKFKYWTKEWTQVQIVDCRQQIARLRQFNDYVFSFANFLNLKLLNAFWQKIKFVLTFVLLRGS